MRAPGTWASSLILLFAATARAGTEAARDTPARGEVECARFLVGKPPSSVSVAEAHELARCFCGLRLDVLWLRADMARSARAGEEQRLREQRVAQILSDVGTLVQETSVTTDPERRAKLVADLGRLIKKLEVELGVGKAGGRTAPLFRPVELEALASAQEDKRQAAGREMSLAVLDLMRHVAERPPAAGQPAPAATGWQVVLPGKAMQAVNEGGARELDRSDWDSYLLDAHAAYEGLKSWGERVRKAPALQSEKIGPQDACGGKDASLVVEVAVRRASLSADLHDVMEMRGLRRPMTGILIQALGLTRASGDGHGAVEQAAQVAVARFESRHFDLRSRYLDVGILGHFGVHPAFNMVLPDPTARSTSVITTTTTTLSDGTLRQVTEEESRSRRSCETPAGGTAACDAPLTPAWKPQFERAVSWSLGLRAGVNLSPMVEVSGFLRGGQVLTGPKVATVEGLNDRPAAGVLLDAGSGASRFAEFGLRFCLFNGGGGGRGHHDLGILRPLLDVEVGRRDDRRFKGTFTDEADIARFGPHPERRQFLRLALSGLRVFGGVKDFEMSIGVDHEWKQGSRGLPEGTKLFVQGRLDLFGLVSAKTAKD